jgi:hypothetical protein
LAVIIKLGILLSGTSVSDGSYLEDYVAGHGYSVRPMKTIRSSALIRQSPSGP